MVKSRTLGCVNARDLAGMNPIFTALSAGFAHAAALLLVAGADVDASDNRGVTPRDMLRISKDNHRNKLQECCVAAALANADVAQEHCDLVREFKELFPCDILDVALDCMGIIE
jgi:ankyrin repeat protein